jgi:hypothetical protein
MAETTKKNYFTELNSVDVGDKIEKKNGLSYLSWSFAWGELKKRYPEANYTVYENAEGWNYFTDGKTCWVKTGVTVNGIEHIEYLPVMDFKNKSIPVGQVTSFDVNKAIQRSLTKAVARHGLGLYIYAGEDLPESECEAVQPTPVAKPKATAKAPVKATPKAEPTPKAEVSEESKELRRKYVKYCQENGVEISKKLNNNSTDDEFAMAYAEAQAEVAAREGELPFELNV